ncbi:MAG: bifunctional oligoribonuclease/PAP phosphatase NrnA [Tenericutes bacterium]|nr:bifunctional oligoribonuclease/PAP phosphatase NrnA [Mycoplasmatota bacterium]
MSDIYKSIYNEVKKYKKIYIARHIGPDPDAFGSQMALKESIKITFPSKEVFAVGTTVSKFKYFGKVDKVNEYDYDNALLIVVDTPDNRRVDIDNFLSFKNVVKIDHHPKVDTFGKVELIDDTASSASELVLEVINNTKLKMNESIAGNLFTGIVSDTNRFLFSISDKTFSLVSTLIHKYKLDTEKLYRQVYSKPLSEIRLMGYIASSLKVDKNGFAYIEIDEDVINSFGADISSASNMINDFNNINEVLVWVFVSHDTKNNMYRVNIRSRGPVINEIASKYNGGGHKFASGVRTDSHEVIENLLSDLKNLCKEYSEKEK